MENKGYGFIPSTQEEIDSRSSTHYLFGAPGRLSDSNMEFVNLIRDGYAPIADQKWTSSCVGQAVARCLQLRYFKLFGKVFDFSALAVYTLARQFAKCEKEEELNDVGCRPALAVRGIAEFGALLTEDWPFDFEKINEELPFDLLAKGTACKIKNTYAINSLGQSRIVEVKHALSKGYPVFVAQDVTPSYSSFRGEGFVPPYDMNEIVLGGHATVIAGYEGNRLYEVNSWGESWGNNGIGMHEESWLLSPRVLELIVFSV